MPSLFLAQHELQHDRICRMTFWTERMSDYGTRVAGGVNPKKAGTTHCGVPVYASAREAMSEGGFDVSVLFIPPLGCKAAALDAIDAGCKKLVILTEHIPVQDVMYFMAAGAEAGARILGPNTAGQVTPGECFVGFMPAFSIASIGSSPILLLKSPTTITRSAVSLARATVARWWACPSSFLDPQI